MKKRLTDEKTEDLFIKQDSICYLRIVTTICVIWLHTCSTLYENQQIFTLNESQILFFGTSYQMMNWAVPVFL